MIHIKVKQKDSETKKGMTLEYTFDRATIYQGVWIVLERQEPVERVVLVEGGPLVEVGGYYYHAGDILVGDTVYLDSNEVIAIKDEKDIKLVFDKFGLNV